MAGYSKKVKAQFRKLVTDAYERELARALAQLASQFAEWQTGRMSAVELSARVHHYDTGTSRELYNLYNLMDREFVVARAVVEESLSEEDIPAEVWPHIRDMVQNLRRYRNNDSEE
jgi:hypothetical protein